MSWTPTLPSAKELVRLILEATMQKHGVTKLFVSEAPSTEQLNKKKKQELYGGQAVLDDKDSEECKY